MCEREAFALRSTGTPDTPSKRRNRDEAVDNEAMSISHGPGWRAVLRATLEHTRTDRISVAAGAFAYRWFLSIFPMIIALLGIASLVAVPSSFALSLIHGAERALPSGAAKVFTQAINQATLHRRRDVVATSIALIIALWSAVSGMVIVEEVLGMAYGVARDRTFLRKRGVGLLLLVGGVILGGGASALGVFGSAIGDAIKNGAPVSGTAFATLWNVVRWIVALAFVNVLFTMLYYFAPNRKAPRWRWTSVGAIIATALWAVVSFGFSLYTSNFSSYNKTYGAFAGVAILIFWLYLTGLAIFVGGEINATYERFDTDKPETLGDEPDVP